MEKHAYCTRCGRYVQLTGETCPAGHGGDDLRDMRSGSLPADAARERSAEPSAQTVSAPSRRPGRQTASATDYSESTEKAGRVLGWLFVVIPSLAVGFFMVALTEPQYESMGIGTVGSWFASFATVAITLGLALAWGWLKLTKKRR